MDVRRLTTAEAPLLVDATSTETGRALWDRHPAGPYSLADAQAALAKWDKDMSFGIFEHGSLVAAVGVMPDNPGSAEMAYWVRPESRGRGLAVAALRHLTDWAHNNGFHHLWLEIHPDNKASQRVAERAGYTYDRRIPNHCEDHDCLIWIHHPQPTTDQATMSAPPTKLKTGVPGPIEWTFQSTTAPSSDDGRRSAHTSRRSGRRRVRGRRPANGRIRSDPEASLTYRLRLPISTHPTYETALAD